MFGPVTFALATGDCLCITGESGSGKSQLLRAIADLDPHGGALMLAGVDACDMAPEQWRRQAGLLPPESSWWLPRACDHFTDGAAAGLERLGLDSAVLQRPVARLSSGERQRLALLRLLANGPRVLLLDEPTANLDADNTRRVEALIGDYLGAHAAAAIWVSHDRGQVARVANRHMALQGGHLVETALERYA